MTTQVRDTMAVAAAGNYSANDVISNSATVGRAWKWFMAGTRILNAKLMIETASQAHVCTLLLFASNPATWATTPVLNDNVTNTAPIWAHISEFIGAIEFNIPKSI